MTQLLANIGRGGIAIAGFLGECLKLLRGFAYWTTVAPFRGYPIRLRESARQSVRVGVKSIPIVFLVNFFVGATLAFIAAVFLVIVGFVWYPVKRYRQRLKAKREAVETGAGPHRPQS